MVNKNKTKKRPSKVYFNKSQDSGKVNSIGDIEKINEFVNDETKTLCKELPFSSISHKQFKLIGMVPESKPTNQVTTIPLKLPLKLLPGLRKAFGLIKLTEKECADNEETSIVTIISFERFIQTGQKTKRYPISLPSLQIVQVPISPEEAEKKFSLSLSETSFKAESINTAKKSPLPVTEVDKTVLTKVTKKRSFFNEIWRKKTIQSVEPLPVAEDIPKTDEISGSGPLSQNDINSSLCLVCGKQAFIAEKIQIGADVFHNTCFKCHHCSKCLYRGKWNKHLEQYFCDYCYKRTVWPFVRR